MKSNKSDTIGRGATTKKQAIALLQKPVHIKEVMKKKSDSRSRKSAHVAHPALRLVQGVCRYELLHTYT